MHILVTGCNHRTAPLAIRERLALDAPAAEQALADFRARFADCEALLLSTCNRLELYLARPLHRPPSASEALEFLSARHGIDPEEMQRVSYVHRSRSAAEHMMLVAASLDSMVLGETQIIGQVREALALAQRAGSIGPVLTRLCQDSIAAARQVHSQTQLSAGRVSVASVAVHFARQVFAELSGKTVLLVGAGKMGGQVAARLIEQRPGRIIAVNRNFQRASDLARKHHGQAVEFSQLPAMLAEADIVVTSTGAREPIITESMVRAAMKARRYRPIFMIDIAVPRDVQPTVAGLAQVYLYNIDDLQRVVESTINGRSEHVERARAMLIASAEQFLAWLHARAIGPTIEAFVRKLADLRTAELDWLIPKLSEAGQRDRELIEQFSHRLVSKLMHDPVRELTEMCGPDSAASDACAQALAQLFKLEIDAKA